MPKLHPAAKLSCLLREETVPDPPAGLVPRRQTAGLREAVATQAAKRSDLERPILSSTWAQTGYTQTLRAEWVAQRLYRGIRSDSYALAVRNRAPESRDCEPLAFLNSSFWKTTLHYISAFRVLKTCVRSERLVELSCMLPKFLVRSSALPNSTEGYLPWQLRTNDETESKIFIADSPNVQTPHDYWPLP